jgi:uncharacterized membrane protein YdjX (TVP38/TMEM64 family)
MGNGITRTLVVPARTRLLLWLAAVVGLLLLGWLADAPALLRAALARIQELGVWGMVIFVLVYILAAIFLLPAVVLTLGAGAIFGIAKGFVLVSIAETLGAAAAFFVGRYLVRDWVYRLIQGNPTLLAIDEAVAREGWRIVGLVRLSPAFPFILLNYAFSVTRVSPREYVLASWIGMMPGTVMYVYLGSLAGNLALLGSGQRVHTPADWALYAFGLLSTLAVTIYVTRLARAALKRRLAD